MNEKRFWNEKIAEIIDTPRVWKSPTLPDKNHSGADWENYRDGVDWLYGLYEMIEENFPKNAILIEIGSFAGVSTSLFACVCEYVYAIDPWTDNKSYKEVTPEYLSLAEKEFDSKLEKYKNIQKIKAMGKDVVQQFPDESVDIVYIDAAHDYVSASSDILMWFPKIAKGGFICGHDFDNVDVKRVLKDLFPSNIPKTYWDSSWIFKKT